jgi:eukaryotic-like serine/threonine-protein kinase
MAANVMLMVRGGALDGKEYPFTKPTKCVIGRAENCLIQLPASWEFQLVSRHHCELHVDPPNIRVCDLGSRNGTYINGKLIGRRPHGELAESMEPSACALYDVHAGDQLWVGPVLFEVKVTGAVAAEKKAVPAAGDRVNEMAAAV